jgi:hypothetical protein
LDRSGGANSSFVSGRRRGLRGRARSADPRRRRAEKDEVVALPVVATIGARAFVDFVTTVFAQRASSGKP